MDASTASQVDQLLSGSLAGIANGDLAAARKSLQAIRHLVGHDADDDVGDDDHVEGNESGSQTESSTDDPLLAARVLSFDVGFVTKHLQSPGGE